MKNNTAHNENVNLHTWHSEMSAVAESSETKLKACIDWQWKNNPGSILDAMKFWSDDRESALELLIQGQKIKWQKWYRQAVREFPDFWSWVFYTPWVKKPDWETLESDLLWQVRHNWESVWNSKNSWESVPSQDIWAYFYLLSGQIKNPQALENYRACWNEDKKRVMTILEWVI